jgi:HSP20 family protein
MTLVKKTNGNAPELESMFGDFFDFNEFFPFKGITTFKSVPSVNVIENGKELKLEVAAPGLSRNDFKIEINRGILTISAEKKDEQLEENDRYTRREFNYSSFSRSFSLPEYILEDQVQAKFDDGVLKVTLPIKEELKKKESKKEIQID